MQRFGIHFWKQLPFLRLLIALCTGILLQRYQVFPVIYAIIVIPLVLTWLIITQAARYYLSYRLRWINGSLITVLFIGIGTMVMYQRDIRNHPRSISEFINGQSTVLASIGEPLTEKTNSFKTVARAEAVWQHNRWIPAAGNILVYSKKTNAVSLVYGTQLLIRANLQPIRNSGNPGAFDYRQYCVSQDILYQVYLQEKDYTLTGKQTGNGFWRRLFRIREKVLATLRQAIPGRKEAGVAEALLIGYRNDLDKELVQSYSNTGVVHIIAISGLHLGMIYGLLLLLFKPLKRKRWSRWLKPVIILLVLWGFCLLTGAAASILRSAVMFSFIVIGESLGRKTQVYNTLAASAFCLLLFNPWFLWDVGFQLSYAAVLSILLFMKPVYRQIYCRNKLLDTVWQLNAITLSAQVLTLPLILYYFHQFPNLFLFTNFIAVPLSGLILYGELLLLLFSWLSVMANPLGKTLSFLISQMNGVIERTDRLPFSITDNIYTDLPATVLAYLIVSCAAVWLLQKRKGFAIAALAGLTAVYGLRMQWQLAWKQQQKLIVYNIPRRQAIDIVIGRRHFSKHTIPPAERNAANAFHFKPARVLFGAAKNIPAGILVQKQLIQTKNSSILLVNKPMKLPYTRHKIPVDMIILSGNPAVYLSALEKVFDCHQYVFDASNPLWKIRYWKKDADSLHLRHHSVPEQGAFVIDL